MNFLVSNDDGILAPGIGLLAEACRRVGQVTVVAAIGVLMIATLLSIVAVFYKLTGKIGIDPWRLVNDSGHA